MKAMIRFYYKMVEAGVKHWTDIPGIWKEDTIKALKENYILNEDGTVVEK